MINIPKWLQSSTNPEQISLTVTSLGNAAAGFITLLGVLGIVDPAIAGQAWGNFVGSVLAAIPAGYAVWHSGVAVYGILRKAGMRLLQLFGTKPETVAPTVVVDTTK